MRTEMEVLEVRRTGLVPRQFELPEKLRKPKSRTQALEIQK
jgi:hypothetical protein